MNSYTITIAPNDDSGNSTTLMVDTSGDQVSITDVHLHAGGGLAGGQLPTVDFGLLLQAISTPTMPRPIGATPAARVVPAVTANERPAGRAAPTRRRGTEAATPPARRGRGGRGSTATNAAAPKATAAPVRKAPRATKAAEGKQERAYRRMPEDFATVYERIGSAAAIADHYGVPRHSVHNWIRRIRATTPPAAE